MIEPSSDGHHICESVGLFFLSGAVLFFSDSKALSWKPASFWLTVTEPREYATRPPKNQPRRRTALSRFNQFSDPKTETLCSKAWRFISCELFVCHKRQYFFGILGSWKPENFDDAKVETYRVWLGAGEGVDVSNALFGRFFEKNLLRLGYWLAKVMATKIECFLANVMVTLEGLCVTNSQFCEVCHADTKFIHIAKTPDTSWTTPADVSRCLDGGRIDWKSPSSARLKLYDFMWTEECHDTELPEFHLTIGQLPLEEATNYHANHWLKRNMYESHTEENCK